jgi:predicted PurR-regulated permease PerM
MALPVREQFKYWGIAAAVLALLLWMLGNVLAPFLLGGALAYLLDPIADWLERRGLSRTWATVVITVFAVLMLVVLIVLLVPTLVRQTTQLVEAAPQMAENLVAFLTERFPSLEQEDSVVRRSLNDIGEAVQARGGAFVQALVTSLGSLVNIVVLFVIVPVVAFYLLMDWDRLVAEIDSLLPRDHAPTIRRLARQIDDSLSGFLRGQGTVCLILGIYYAVALMAVGLQFGLVVGLLAGFLSFIPSVGAIVGGVLAIGLALCQFWGEWVWVSAGWAILQSGQFVGGHGLTPKLVGGHVGLHPVWLIFALSAFGALFGFVGLLVAVPVAAVIGVLIRFAVEQYRASSLYRGVDDGGAR